MNLCLYAYQKLVSSQSDMPVIVRSYGRWYLEFGDSHIDIHSNLVASHVRSHYIDLLWKNKLAL